ncbi:hypothetical protein TrVE_jg13721 [Triparma verrucosa]|uniref:Flavodoxin-like domain-containing protein n=1 Tax=Triparma verrucosa TaxID=1606542 RepID=A0A9W7BE96_9STRA|nr:hypothetical protein TrVE_jg13721 [Triparma verrucosa]
MVLVVYASQTSNSLNAATSLCSSLSLPPPLPLDTYIQTLPPTNLLIIILSSYGHGASPLGGRLFRSVLSKPGLNFKNLKFCLLGLGSRDYITFFFNPKFTTLRLIDEGATLVKTPSFDPVKGGVDPECDGVGVADSSGDDQDVVIERWVKYVKDVVVPEFEDKQNVEVEGKEVILEEARRVYEEENGEEVKKQINYGGVRRGLIIIILSIAAKMMMNYITK